MKETLEQLKTAVLEYDMEGAAKWARQALNQGVDPLQGLEALTVAIREVGEGFASGDLFLPDLVGAADAMQSALPILQGAFASSGQTREPLGVVVIGTVAGDIHTIGKSMVGALLSAEGFEVNDLGINVSAEQFVNAVKEHGAGILAMSALLSVTAPEMQKVIDTMAEQGIREQVKVMVGGGAITASFAKSIGADGYSATAPGAVKLARELFDL
ncbi:MAG: cobalamin-dependent protein [Anaerolineales bacterium]|nr:cobalamin-dependent protein [Anaerolineales bacterium]